MLEQLLQLRVRLAREKDRPLFKVFNPNKLLQLAIDKPETPEAPIQVLGALESAGLEFDALWASGLTDEAWPLVARPNPFIPPALQRKAGIPEASAEASLARAQRITAGWLGAAAEVVFPRRASRRRAAPKASPAAREPTPPVTYILCITMSFQSTLSVLQ